nr:hypothetical protein [Clostridia bacterium]
METYTSGKKTGRRGRPAKDRPEVSDEAVRAVRQMLKKKGGKNGYQAAKEKCLILPKARPTLMRKLKLNTERYEVTGRIDYNRDLASRVHKDDRDYIESYEKSMYTVWLLEHGVASITDERTRAIAVDTLLEGRSCSALEQKYGMTDRGIRKHKRSGLIEVAALAERTNFCSVFASKS